MSQRNSVHPGCKRNEARFVYLNYVITYLQKYVVLRLYYVECVFILLKIIVQYKPVYYICECLYVCGLMTS